MSNPRWTLDHVSYQPDGAPRPTVSDVSLFIADGRLTAILGPNGAGKSTLLRLMLGTLAPIAGTVLFDGRRLDDWTRRELAQRIGVVPQGEMEPIYTVREMVAMGRYPHLGPWQRERAEDIQAIRAAMERCDVTQFSDRWMSTLSGGEQQRVRLARALAQEPGALVLDEPTTSLDVRHEMATFELLRGLREEGTTVVLVTHNLNLAARYADDLVLLDRGRLVAIGTPAEVLTADLVSRVYEWPIGIVSHEEGVPQILPRALDRSERKEREEQ
jgi:ABC-type cobalamin/Fe3+-siderophores transport systems, ATPase components